MRADQDCLHSMKEFLCAGLLTSGLIPCLRHAAQNLVTDDAVIMPSSARVFVQAIEARTGNVCDVDMSGVNVHRWHPAYLSGVPQTACPG